jgi:hypothetical protein
VLGYLSAKTERDLSQRVNQAALRQPHFGHAVWQLINACNTPKCWSATDFPKLRGYEECFMVYAPVNIYSLGQPPDPEL